MLLYYKNSVLASIVSILGCAAAILGITFISEGDIVGGIVSILIGVPLLFWGNIISKNKAFKKWWKQVEDAGLVPEISQSTQTAISIYNKNPQNRTLKKITELNPTAATQIKQQLAAKKAK